MLAITQARRQESDARSIDTNDSWVHLDVIPGLPSSQRRGNPVLRIVLQRAWLNLNFPAVAQPISPLIQDAQREQSSPHEVAEHDVDELLIGSGNSGEQIERACSPSRRRV